MAFVERRVLGRLPHVLRLLECISFGCDKYRFPAYAGEWVKKHRAMKHDENADRLRPMGDCAIYGHPFVDGECACGVRQHHQPIPELAELLALLRDTVTAAMGDPQRDRVAALALNGRWSRDHDSCVACGGTDRAHRGRGLCEGCSARVSRLRARERWQQEHSGNWSFT